MEQQVWSMIARQSTLRPRVAVPHKGASSIRKQTQQLRWWKAHLGYCLVADITPALVAQYRDILARGECIPRSNATVSLYLAALSHVFTIAVQEWQWCDDSPIRQVRKPRLPRGRVRFLSDDERQHLLESCQASRNRYLSPVVVLALATGARKGELLGLRWPDVDLQRGTLTFQETKNGERRAVPLTGQALALMRQHAKVRRLDTMLVFPDATGQRPVGIREAWEYAVKRAGIVDFRFHDLRHSAASYLAMSGASLAEIAEVLGHKTPGHGQAVCPPVRSPHARGGGAHEPGCVRGAVTWGTAYQRRGHAQRPRSFWALASVHGLGSVSKSTGECRNSEGYSKAV